MGTAYRNLKKYCYFSCLSDGALESLSKKMSLIEVLPGTEIIKENTPADSFYLVKEGEVEVLKKTMWGQSARISVLGNNEGFGEMALLTCSPRCCSVVSKTNVTLYKLGKKDFEEIARYDCAFSHVVEKKINDYTEFNRLKTLQPFALLPPEKMAVITDKLVEEKYSPGENILTQGDKGDKYYIIKRGKVAVLKKNFEDEIEQVAVLTEGEGFGEEALITDSPRNATIRVTDETVVLVLSRADFDGMMKTAFVEEVTPEEVLSYPAALQNFVDVRMKMEYDEEHLPDAMHIPLDEIRKRYIELDPSEEYFVYCLVGARSATASYLLNSLGCNARSIKGGMVNWPGQVVEGKEGVHGPHGSD